MEDIMKIVKSLEKSGLLIKRVSETFVFLVQILPIPNEIATTIQ